jgi:flagellar biosynthesis protein FlhB
MAAQQQQPKVSKREKDQTDSLVYNRRPGDILTFLLLLLLLFKIYFLKHLIFFRNRIFKRNEQKFPKNSKTLLKLKVQFYLSVGLVIFSFYLPIVIHRMKSLLLYTHFPASLGN